MDLWSEIKKLQGKTLRTLDRGNRFDIIDVDHKHVIVIPTATHKERPISRKEIEAAFQELSVYGRITRTQIEERHSRRNPAYVAAILAELPGTRYTIRPIVIFLT